MKKTELRQIIKEELNLLNKNKYEKLLNNINNPELKDIMKLPWPERQKKRMELFKKEFDI